MLGGSRVLKLSSQDSHPDHGQSLPWEGPGPSWGPWLAAGEGGGSASQGAGAGVDGGDQWASCVRGSARGDGDPGKATTKQSGGTAVGQERKAWDPPGATEEEGHRGCWAGKLRAQIQGELVSGCQKWREAQTLNEVREVTGCITCHRGPEAERTRGGLCSGDEIREDFRGELLAYSESGRPPREEPWGHKVLYVQMPKAQRACKSRVKTREGGN